MMFQVLEDGITKARAKGEMAHTNSQIGCLNRVCETKSRREENFESRWWEEEI
jgi:hypothetical protein